jgi:peptide/nickel transport system substrate-binding protein
VVFVVQTVGKGSGMNGTQGANNYFGVTESAFMTEWDGGAVPMLVKEWEISPDQTKLTWHLQEDVQFHKGHGEMTAEDVAWNLNDTNATTNPESIAGMAGDYAAMFGESRAIDDYTVEIDVKSYNVTWYANQLNVESIAFGVYSSNACEENGEEWCKTNIIGTGPFEMVEFRDDERVTVKAVPDHWRETAKISQLTILQIPEEATRKAMLTTGEADMGIVPIREEQSLIERGLKVTNSGRVDEIPVNFGGNFWETNHALTGEPLVSPGLDPTKPWIGDPSNAESMERARKVRQALAMAFDKDLINQTLFNGSGVPYHINMFSPADPNFQDKWEIEFNKAEAMRLLDEAGYPAGSGGKRMDAVLFGASTNANWSEPVEAIAGFWREIGVFTEIQKTDYAVFRPTVVDRSNSWMFVQSCRHNRGQAWDWPRGEQATSLTRGGFGCGVEIPKILETFRAVNAEPDASARIQLNNGLADYMLEWMPAAGIVALPSNVVFNPRSIESWNMRKGFESFYNAPERIVPAAR